MQGNMKDKTSSWDESLHFFKIEQSSDTKSSYSEKQKIFKNQT